MTVIESGTAGQPSGGPASLADVKGQLSIALADTRDDDAIANVLAVVNEVVQGLPVAQGVTGAWPRALMLGAAMLAARVYNRRTSPSGSEPISGSVTYVMRTDPDVAMLLHLGEWSSPAVG